MHTDRAEPSKLDPPLRNFAHLTLLRDHRSIPYGLVL
jgi:hypothetical protein